MNNSNIQQPFNKKWNLFGGIGTNSNDIQKKKKRKPVCTCHLAYQNIPQPPLPSSLPAELNIPLGNQQMIIYDNDTNRSMVMDSASGYNYNNDQLNRDSYLTNQCQAQSSSLIKNTIHSNIGLETSQHPDLFASNNNRMGQNHLEQAYLMEHQQTNFNNRNNACVGPYLGNNLMNDPNIQYNIYHQQNNVITYSPDMNLYRKKRLQNQLMEADNARNMAWSDGYRFRSNSVPNDSTQYDYLVQQQRQPPPGLLASQHQHSVWPPSGDFPCQCNQCCSMAAPGSMPIPKSNFDRKALLNYEYGSSTPSIALPSTAPTVPSKPRVSFGPLMTYPIMDDAETSYKQHLENLRKKEEKKTSSKLTTELLPLDTQISQMMGDSALICRIL